MKKVKVEKKKIGEKGTKTISEFKSFIARGNVVDLAVGVIIGGAFGKIVTSIVNDILNHTEFLKPFSLAYFSSIAC